MPLLNEERSMVEVGSLYSFNVLPNELTKIILSIFSLSVLINTLSFVGLGYISIVFSLFILSEREFSPILTLSTSVKSDVSPILHIARAFIRKI